MVQCVDYLQCTAYSAGSGSEPDRNWYFGDILSLENVSYCLLDGGREGPFLDPSDDALYINGFRRCLLVLTV